jgi:hypothetical protein
MKKAVIIAVAVGVLLIGVLAIVFISVREPLSLTFLEYQPLRAKLKLTNNSSKTISYLTDYSDGAALALPKTSAGWTNSSRELVSGTMMDAATGKTMPMYTYAEPGFITNGSGVHTEFLLPKYLEPGQSAELYAWLQADGSPTRAGTVCIVPQGKLAEQFGRCINRVKHWCRMKSTPPGVVEAWCADPLQDPTSPMPATNHHEL